MNGSIGPDELRGWAASLVQVDVEGARSSWRTRLVPNAAGPDRPSATHQPSASKEQIVSCMPSAQSLFPDLQPLLLSNSLRPASSPCVALNTSGRRLSQRPPLDHNRAASLLVNTTGGNALPPSRSPRSIRSVQWPPARSAHTQTSNFNSKFPAGAVLLTPMNSFAQRIEPVGPR